ncbi:D-alanine--D-alanine ligase [Atopococcus tabaci]|uniref:D-alanine--D-alanine ligase n=1 Tax=Atopococcus tabaci TaxID=269774 RepID=UPI00041B351B|nr:D-alanine--D-alanine ligase [Atopococcus tabaci]
MKIFMIYGGKSAEHDISILSAHSIMTEIYYEYYEVIPVYITRDGKWVKGPRITRAEEVLSQEDLRLGFDEEGVQSGKGTPFELSELQEKDAIAFPVLHGPNGEDGTIQGLFEVLNVPYVGAGVLASACGMDKSVSKILFQNEGLPQVPYKKVLKNEWEVDSDTVLAACQEELAYPLFVKPANLGSSVGISKAENRDQLIEAIRMAFEYDRIIVIEQGVDAREIEVAVLGNEDIHTSVPGELVKQQGFYDYESKYLKNEVVLQIPAKLSDDIKTQLREYAARAFSAVQGSGLSRVDFFLTEDDEIYLNEINTFPGFTQFSMYPRLWESTGLAYGDLIEELIQLGLQRFRDTQNYDSKDREN